jgi:hypothetical protein
MIPISQLGALLEILIQLDALVKRG